MIKTMTLEPGQKLTSEQIARLKAARSRPIVYDEDSPKLTREELMEFRRVGARMGSRRVEGPEDARDPGSIEASVPMDR